MSYYPPDRFPPETPPPDPYGSAPTVASGRVVPAGVCLFIVGLVNLLLPGLLFVGGVNTARATTDEIAAAQEEQIKLFRQWQAPPEFIERMEKTTPEDSIRQGIMLSFGCGGLTFVAALLCMLGGWRMWSLRNYGLALTGAIVAAIPCVSSAACCGIGEGIGIWALVVLLNPEVRAAFR